jgi:hypothetical protein
MDYAAIDLQAGTRFGIRVGADYRRRNDGTLGEPFLKNLAASLTRRALW